MPQTKAISAKWALASTIAAGIAVSAATYVAYGLTHGVAVADGPRLAASTTPTLASRLTVKTSIQAQKASGIATARISSDHIRPTANAYADVIDLQPLFDLRNKWAAAKADLDTAQARETVAQEKYNHNIVLFGGKNAVSQQTLQDSYANLLSNQAKLQASKAALSSIEAMLRQQFGLALAREAITARSDVLDRLAAGQASVVRVSLPSDVAAPERLSLDGPENQSVSATKLSRSPMNDPVIQGTPFLYLADGFLPARLRLTARITRSDPEAGLLIPFDAVVWYGGRRWVYFDDKPGLFVRRPIPQNAFQTANGLVVATGFSAGEKIVVQGAQLLLSQEMRAQNIATACKDPPECDD